MVLIYCLGFTCYLLYYIIYLPVWAVQKIIEATRTYVFKPHAIKISAASGEKYALVSLVKPGKIEKNRVILLVAGDLVANEIRKIETDLVGGIANGYTLSMLEYKKRAIAEGQLRITNDHFAKHQPHYQDSKQLGILWGHQIYRETRMRKIFASRKELGWINWRESDYLEVPQVAVRAYRRAPPITYLQTADKYQVAELAIPYEGIKVWDGVHCINHPPVKEWAISSYPVYATNDQKAITRIANELAGKLKELLGKKMSIPVS